MQNYLRLCAPAFFVAGMIAAPAAPRKPPRDAPVRGIAIHFCSCSAPCPCMFRDGDMEGCTLVAVYHFTDGGYAGPWVEGLTYVRAMRPENQAVKGEPDEVTYVPAGLSEQRQATLRSLVAEQVLFGGKPVNRQSRILFQPVNGGYRVEIPGVFKAQTTPMRGAEKKQLVVENVDFAEATRWQLGQADVHEYKEPATGWEWTFPKSNGAWAHFSWGPHVDPGEPVKPLRKRRK